jgi:hypothetical protein
VEYSHYSINGYHFWRTKLEASHPLATTTNNSVVTSAADASSHIIDYYDILQKSIEYTFGGTKELRVVFLTIIGLTQSLAQLVSFMHQYCACKSITTGVLHNLS